SAPLSLSISILALLSLLSFFAASSSLLAAPSFPTRRSSDLDALFARLAELADQQERTDAAPIRRAMSNLRAVLIHRLGRADVQIDRKSTRRTPVTFRSRMPSSA